MSTEKCSGSRDEYKPAKVELYMYDLGNGVLNWGYYFKSRGFEGLWHSAIVVNNWEYYYGEDGITRSRPNGEFCGYKVERIHPVGTTTRSEERFQAFLYKLRSNEFHKSKYDLFLHNCNTFSERVAVWLTGCSIPKQVRDVSRAVQNCPFSGMYRSLYETNRAARKLSGSSGGGWSSSSSSSSSNSSCAIQ